MAIFPKKEGGTKVGNALRAVFTAPASVPKPTINPISVPNIQAPVINTSGILSSVSNALAPIKASASTIQPKPAVPAMSSLINTNISATKPKQQNYAGSTYAGTSIPNSSMIPNMSMAPKSTGANMSMVPTSTGSSGGATRTFGAGSTTTIQDTGSSYWPTAPQTDTTAYSRTSPIGEMFGGSDYSGAGDIYRSYMSGGDIVDTSSIRSRAIADVQDRINALNQVYDAQLARVKQEGLGRTGETTAALAARGLAGSMRGGAIADLTREQNRNLEANVDAERNNAIQGILADANRAATEEIKAKTEARVNGATALISFLKGQDERKSAFIASVAQNLISSGVDPSTMSPQDVANLENVAQKAGVSVKNIIAAYQDAAYKASQGEAFTLGKDQVRYDKNGKLVASNIISGGSGDGTFSAEVMALAKDLNDGIITPQQVPSALRGAVSLARQTLPNPRINELDQVISTIDELAANPRLKAILGPIDQARGSLLLGSKANVAKNLYDQLVGILALEGRSKLKGSGAISDFEFKVLKEAQSALGRNLNETEFKKQLEKVRTVLENRKIQLGGASSAMTLEPLSEDERQQLLNEGYSQEEIDSLNPNKVGSGTYSAVNIPSSSRLAYVNNNPGNLRFVGQPGAVRGANGFAKYSSPQAGYEGLLRQIKIDSDRGLTLAQFVNKYAPPTENDTRLYMNQIARATGASLNTPINRINIHTLGKAIAQKESGTRIA